MSGSFLIATLVGGPQDGSKIEIRTPITRITFTFDRDALTNAAVATREYVYLRTAPDKFTFKGPSTTKLPFT
jgi:hypothetical protein